MKQYLSFLQSTPLFAGISVDDLFPLLKCLSFTSKTYFKNQIIFQMGSPAVQAGIVHSGSIQITSEDFMGNRTILAQLSPGELFGESFACIGTHYMPVNAIAAENCEVFLFNCVNITSPCSSSCPVHHDLLKNFIHILASKNVFLSQRIEIISRRTTREKLVAILSAQAKATGSNHFTLPFNRQELADFLCVERSAMSAALGKMKRDGIIDFNKSNFTLLKTSYD